MEKLQATLQEQPTLFIAITSLIALIIWQAQIAFSNIYLHPLSKYPGPKLAAISYYWKGYVECLQGISWHLALETLHQQYGPVVRVGPNELHFAEPQAYHDIYNNFNRWDKEPTLYHSFNEDRSAFGFLTYKEAKERKNVLATTFSLKSVTEGAGILQEKVDALCVALEQAAAKNETVNLSWAYRCMTVDIITYYCFGKSVHATKAPKFNAPIVIAMEASTPVFKFFKYSTIFKNMILKCPRRLSRIISPLTAGLIDLQELLETQINELSNRPDRLDALPHRMTIYHQMMSKESYKSGTVPSKGSLHEEAQSLIFAGTDTTANTLLVATFYILRSPQVLSKLKTELSATYRDPRQAPSHQDLEKSPYLNACLKEALRMSSGVVSGLPRIVPENGARIVGRQVPPGTIVSIGSTFVHYNTSIFPDPFTFRPERWLETPDLDTWLVAFSRGPRACLGINLAWSEIRLGLATVLRKFELELDAKAPKQLKFVEAFLPLYIDGAIDVKIRKADE